MQYLEEGQKRALGHLDLVVSYYVGAEDWSWVLRSKHFKLLSHLFRPLVVDSRQLALCESSFCCLGSMLGLDPLCRLSASNFNFAANACSHQAPRVVLWKPRGDALRIGVTRLTWLGEGTGLRRSTVQPQE